MSYSKYYIYKRQYSDDDGVTWHDVYPAETEPGGEPIGTYDTLAECEGSPVQYRWVRTDDTVCVNNSFKLMATYNNGNTSEWACDGSTRLTGEPHSGNYSAMTSAEIGDCVTTIGIGCFYDCTSLTSVTIPNTVNWVSKNAFNGCTSLSSINIPSGVTYIGEGAFFSATSLINITIPDSVTSIDEAAFMDCPILTSVTINATTPPSLGSSVFDNTGDCPIYVPAGSVNDYKTAWSTYASRIQAIP